MKHNGSHDTDREALRRAYERERDEPDERKNPVPVWFLIFSVIIIGWGMSYFYLRTGTQVGAGDMRSPIVAEAGGTADGSAIYASNCASCHQASGQGLPGVFPPLDDAGWVVAEARVPVQILLHGINGKITVKGQTYQGVMPSFGTLSDAEMAAVATYIRQNWSNQASTIDATFVAEQRKLTAERTQPWAGGDEIRQVVGGP